MVKRYNLRPMIDGDNVMDWPRDLRHGPNVVLAPDYDALAARLAEAERDAVRYRWLRGDGGPHSLRWLRWSIQHWTGHWNPVQGADMDAAIDAAMGEKS